MTIYADNTIETLVPIDKYLSLKIYHDRRQQEHDNEYTFVLTVDGRDYETDIFFRGDEIIEAARIISALQKETQT